MLSLYIHWPFCAGKCSYCSFVSISDLSVADAYLAALIGEIEEAGRIYAAPVRTIYIGGGTPSVGDGHHIGAILDTVLAGFSLRSDAEITMEANPSSITRDKLAMWHDAGVNRISLGMQAFQDYLLKTLGRLNTADEFARAYDLVRDAGFDNVSVDLIYGYPKQTRHEWIETITAAAALCPEHISTYCLSLEETTPMAEHVSSGVLPMPEEDLQALMYEDAMDCLASYGYSHYEISNFALPGYECRHNLVYWTDRDYLGLGASAHSRVGLFRFANASSVEWYMNDRRSPHLHYDVTTMLGLKDELEEFLMLRTRLTSGFEEKEYERAFGVPFRMRHRNGVIRCIQEGLIEFHQGRVMPTRRGLLFQNRLALHLISDIAE